jgi:hypothetical protein
MMPMPIRIFFVIWISPFAQSSVLENSHRFYPNFNTYK